MEHLTLEALARLLDEEPRGGEREHLSSCLHCTAELASMRDQTEALADLPDVRPPQGDWEVVEARLVSEGIVRKRNMFGVTSLGVTPGWMRSAAALVLFAGGIGLGSALTSHGQAAEPTMDSLADLVPVESAVRPASLGQAEDAVRLAERQYMDAMLQYREMRNAGDGGFQVADPAGRFAALEALVATSRAAVREAPADPFLNGILISAMAERQAVLQRVSGNAEWY